MDPSPSPATSPWARNPHLPDVIDEQVDAEAADGWLLRHRLTTEGRRVSLRRVFLNGQPHWMSAYAVMMLLAAGIATLGLSQDSAATVIGSMIIAPLGQPIVALGAALAMGWARETGRLALVVVIGSAAVVAVAYAMGLLLPDATPNGQILSRTSPDLRDLGVAVLAGAAGAYAYVRDELSGVLPGVAIAVALVPPLATLGLMLEAGHRVLAAGAATLFATNMVGITVAGAFVMLVTGFAPRPRLRRLGAAAMAALLLGGAALVAVSIPLTTAYLRVVSAADESTAVHAAVANAVGPGGPPVLDVSISDGAVSVVIGAGSAVDTAAIDDAVRAVMGAGTVVDVRTAG